MVILTGTPAPNGYADLWPQVYLLDCGERLGKTVGLYRATYFDPDQRNQQIIFTWKPKAGAIEAINKKISDICVSMRAADWLELKEPILNDVMCTLPDEALADYKQLEKDLLLPYVEGDVVASTAAVLSNKLLQLANGAVYDEHQGVRHIHDVKLDALEEIVEAANGQPVLIYYNYKHDKDRIMKRLKVRTLETEKDIRDWNAGRIPVLIAHPASCGHGLNLQHGGHIMVWFGLTWNLEYYEQANARLQRSGQQKQVIIHRILMRGTLDERCAEALKTKAVGQTALMEAVKAKIKKAAEEMK